MQVDIAKGDYKLGQGSSPRFLGLSMYSSGDYPRGTIHASGHLSNNLMGTSSDVHSRLDRPVAACNINQSKVNSTFHSSNVGSTLTNQIDHGEDP